MIRMAPSGAGSNAAGLSLLRDMLVREEAGADRSVLQLLSGVPRAWLKPGQKLEILRAPSRFGPLDLKVDVRSERNVEVRLQCRFSSPPDELRLLVPLPSRRKISRVRVNGQTWPHFDGQLVRLPVEQKDLSISIESG